jgi:hypothetical protein
MSYWLPLIYQFAVGGFIFAIGFLIPWRRGDYIWRRKEDRFTLLAMVFTVLVYFILQVLWNLYGLGKI